MDWTPILTGLIAVLGVLAEEQVRRHVLPWLKNNNLIETAKYVVLAAEALYGRGNGDQKLVYALEALKEKGFNIESNEVIAAIKAAWKALDIEQIAAGIKTAE